MEAMPARRAWDNRTRGRLRRRLFLLLEGDNMPAIIHQPDGTTTFEALPGEEEQQAAHRLELHERFGSPLSTDEYVALARRRLAQAPAAVVPGAVGDVATEAKIAYLLGPDLTAAVRRR